MAHLLPMVVVCSIMVQENPNDFGAALKRVLEQFNAPGGAAAVVRDGRLIAIGTAGVRKLGEPAAVERDDLLLIGSCGKSITRLLIGRLVDQGLLRMESTLGELLPDVKMRDEYKAVTIGNLLAHRGGIQPYTMITPAKTPILFNTTGGEKEQRAAFAAHLLMEEPKAKPGTRFVYSNAGYGLLGHIAERLKKKPYEELVRDEVFGPLGMTSAIVGQPHEGKGAGLHGHFREDGEYKPAERRRAGLPAIAPAGMMSCSIEDFAKMAAFLARSEAGKPGGFLTPGAAAALREARPGDSSGEGEVFYGGDGYYTAAFAVWPSRDLAIVVGTNAGSNDEVCQAAIDAARQAYAADVPARVREGGEPTAGRRPLFGFGLEATGPDEVMVSQVKADSPAEKAGLKAGDRVIEVGSRPLSELDEEQRMELFRKSPLELTVERDGKRIKLTLKAES